MNKYLNELLHYLPVSSSKSKKLDKISILKTAVNHMKNLKGKPSFPASVHLDSFDLKSGSLGYFLQRLRPF